MPAYIYSEEGEVDGANNCLGEEPNYLLREWKKVRCGCVLRREKWVG